MITPFVVSESLLALVLSKTAQYADTMEQTLLGGRTALWS